MSILHRNSPTQTLLSCLKRTKRLEPLLLLLSLLLITFGVSLEAQAQEPHESIEDIRNMVKSAVAKHYNKNTPHSRVTTQVANLDARLRLAKCPHNKNIKINNRHKTGSNVSVRVSCNGQTPWSIFVPVKVSVFQEVATATRDIIKGEVLGEGDLVVQERNTSSLGFGFAKNTQALLGKAATRNIAAGHAIRLTHVSNPIVVKRGDKITLQSNRRGLAVHATAIAISKGKVGDQIRVKNKQSQRIIEAFVTAPGKAVAKL